MTSIPLHSASPVSPSSSEEAPASGSPSTISDLKGVLPEHNSPSQSSPSAETAPLIHQTTISGVQQPTSIAQQHPPTPTRTALRLNTRTSMPGSSLPWQTDTTSSPFTPTSHSRKPSYAPPPRSNASNNYHPTNIDTSISTTSSPMLPPYQFSSPSPSLSSSPYPPTPSLTNPPGYTQNTHPSFSAHSPFYFNAQSTHLTIPQTPTRRPTGRGILDNDPTIYLTDDTNEDEDSYWDTAAKWAKAAGKRLSQGEQQLWKMVNAISTGENDD